MSPKILDLAASVASVCSPRPKNNHMKRCSVTLITREMQLQITMRFHDIPIRTVKKNFFLAPQYQVLVSMKTSEAFIPYWWK